MDWFREVFRRQRRYHELSEQIREHLEEKIADLMDRGLTRNGSWNTRLAANSAISL